MNTRAVGTVYEYKAAAFLKQHGIQIKEQNYRCRFGEIDIIGMQRGTYVFIEVKYRKTDTGGSPAEAVTHAKQRTICKVADYYRMLHGIGDDVSCRFDVVAICGEQSKEEIIWYENAFMYIKRGRS